ncbi:hypothetical protein F4774DRAFT_236704 [Daldinia eschscholtzii]|nr:hypothetical protein F4774DRAFT_236704 [Daldinia eschscholtzii]
MCDYTQVEYCCQHLRFVVQRWCSVYERTNKVCAPNVTHLEIRHDELCFTRPCPTPLLTCVFQNIAKQRNLRIFLASWEAFFTP